MKKLARGWRRHLAWRARAKGTPPLPILELAAHALGDAPEAEAEEKDEEDEDDAAGEEIVAVRRVHHVLVERQRTLHGGNLRNHSV